MSEIINDNIILELLGKPSTAEQGFNLLVLKYQERLYWHIRRIVVNHDDTDDVIQNTFIKVFRNIHKFEQKSKLYTWLYRIASNESITFINKRKKLAKHSFTDESNIVEQLAADEYFDGDLAEKKLVAALALLPDKQKQVFNLRYYDEMPYAEISEMLGTSVGGLKASYHIAAKKIEQYLTQNA